MQVFGIQNMLDLDLAPVEQINERRGGWSGVYALQNNNRSLFLKCQRNHVYREPRRFFLRTPTLYREFLYLKKMQRIDVPATPLVFYLQDGKRAFILTRRAEGIPLNDYLLSGPPEEERDRVILKLAEILHRMHSHRVMHGCIYSKHIFVEAGSEIRITLIDFEKARFSYRPAHGAAKDLSRLFRRTPLLREADRQQITAYYEKSWPGFAAILSGRIDKDST